MGRFLDMIQPGKEESRNPSASAKQAKNAKEGTDGSKLETRLDRLGISIAIDRATNSALLIFNEAGAAAVLETAAVHKPFEVVLTHAQRRELAAHLEYYEGLLRRRSKKADRRASNY